MVKMFELKAVKQKSFYGKAIVTIDDDGGKTLYSYGTPILKQMLNGDFVRLWDGWTATTGKHIAAFCGMNKAQYLELSYRGN